MVNQSLSTSSTVVQSVEELFEALSALPPLVHCRKCGSRLLQMNATFFSYGGKVWNLPLPVCTNCEPTRFNLEPADVATPATAPSGFGSIPEKRSLMIHFDQALPGFACFNKTLPAGTWQQLYECAIVVPGLDVCCFFDVGDAAGYFEGAGR